MDQQREIDWTRSSQLQALRRLRLDGQTAPDGSRVSGMVLQRILEKIDDHAGKSGWCFCKIATLADEARCGLRTVKRALAVLRSLSLLVEVSGRNERGYPFLSWRICWPNLADFEVESTDSLTRLPSASDQKPSATVTKPSATVTKPSATVTKPSATMAPTSVSAPEAPREAPPPFLPPGSTRARDGWRRVVVVLRKLGVSQADRAVSSARSNGATPETCRAIAEHWRAEAQWDAGALYFRVRNAIAGDDPSQGWPPGRRKARHAIPSRPPWHAVEGQILKSCKARGLDEAEIDRRLETAEQQWAAGKIVYQNQPLEISQ